MTPRAFALIVAARAVARQEAAVIAAWHIEAFARTKRLKPLEDLLKRAKPKSPEQKAADLAAALERMAAKSVHQGTPDAE